MSRNLALAAVLAVAWTVQDQRAQFRAGVELVQIDVAVLDASGLVLDRRDVPPAWIESFRDQAPAPGGVSSTVYTLL